MNVMGISSALTSEIASTGGTGNQQTIAVLKKANSIQGSVASQLLASLPEPAKAPDPDARIGRNLDVRA